MPSWEFVASGPVDTQIRVPAGGIAVKAAASPAVTVDIEPAGTRRGGADDVRVDFSNGRLTITAPERKLLWGSSLSFRVAVTVPEGSPVTVDAASADIDLTGVVGAVFLHTASGDVTAQQVTGPADVHTASGDVNLAQAGPASVKSVSGDVSIAAATGDVSAQSVSGDVKVGSVAGGRVEVKTTSGDITVAVVPGISVQLDLSTLSGQASSDLDYSGSAGEATAAVICHAISGDVRVIREAGATTH